MAIASLLSISFIATGCAGFGQKMKAFLAGQESSDGPGAESAATASGPKYSEKANHWGGPRRTYSTLNKRQFQDAARIDGAAGSLWVQEGQGSYLFSQNIIRMIGDPLTVKIEGESREQLAAKSQVITELLDKLERRRQELNAAAQMARQPASGSVGATANPAASADPAAGAPSGDSNKEAADFKIKAVPTRIVERLVDGNYRIKGQQSFMIKAREYKAIVTGIVRAEDFSDDGISSNRLIDPKFDIVSSKKGDTP